MSDTADVPGPARPPLPTIGYATDQIEPESAFSRESVFLLQRQVEAKRYQERHRPFRNLWLLIFLFTAFMQTPSVYLWIVGVAAMLIGFAFLHWHCRGMVWGARLVAIESFVYFAALALLLWADTAMGYGVAAAIALLTIGALVTAATWIFRLPRWTELEVIRVDQRLVKRVDDACDEIRRGRFDRVAHFQRGPLGAWLRVARVGEILMAVGESGGPPMFALPERVVVDDTTIRPITCFTSSFVLRWDTRGILVRAERKSIAVLDRLREEAIRAGSAARQDQNLENLATDPELT